MTRNTPTRVSCGHCGWRTSRVNIVFLDVDYDEYTPSYGYCPHDGAVLYPVAVRRMWRTQAARPQPPAERGQPAAG